VAVVEPRLTLFVLHTGIAWERQALAYDETVVLHSGEILGADHPDTVTARHNL
jgi:hypothetical protein